MIDGVPLDLGWLGFERGAHLLVSHALRERAQVQVIGGDPALGVHLRAWCRAKGHGFAVDPGGGWTVDRGPAQAQRWTSAQRAGGPSVDGIVRRPPAHWGLAARGALVEAGGPSPAFDLDDRDVVWADLAPRLYAHAAAAQWDPATAVDWSGDPPPPEIESAVVQVMTYLVENEQAALVIPARLLARVHPTSARCSNCSRCRPPTRRGTSRCSPAARCCTAARWARRRPGDARRWRPC